MPVSGLSNALSGINAASRRISASSHNVANLLTEDFRPVRANAQTVSGGGVRVTLSQASEPAPVDLAQELVDSELALVQAKASARVMETGLDLLGALLNLRA